MLRNALMAGVMLAPFSDQAMAQNPTGVVDGDTWFGDDGHVMVQIDGKPFDTGMKIDRGAGPVGTIPQVDVNGHLILVTTCGALSPEALKQIKDALK